MLYVPNVMNHYIRNHWSLIYQNVKNVQITVLLAMTDKNPNFLINTLTLVVKFYKNIVDYVINYSH